MISKTNCECYSLAWTIITLYHVSYDHYTPAAWIIRVNSQLVEIKNANLDSSNEIVFMVVFCFEINSCNMSDFWYDKVQDSCDQFQLSHVQSSVTVTSLCVGLDYVIIIPVSVT